ncbi:MAG: aminotransferase class V-fold PLP-dependent enzyme [Pirellulales bacterium]
MTPNESSFPAGPASWPLADDDVLAALEAAYADGSWGRYHGPNCQQLAAALTEYHAVDHVTLCCSGTVAVELALRGLKIGPGDEVLLAGYDFAGNFRAIEAVGARPALVDIDPATWCMDIGKIDAAIGPETRAVIVSHLHGGLVPMRRLMEIAAARGLAVVEDACQAPGAIVDGRRAGTWGDAGVLSFGGSKLLTAGRGGAVLTRSAEVQQRIKVFAERGNDAFALSELQAAVLVPQLAKLDDRNAIRRERARQLLAQLADVRSLAPVRINEPPDEPAFYKIAWRVAAVTNDESTHAARERFIAGVQREGLAIDAGFRGFSTRGSRRCRQATSLEHSQLAAAATVVLHHPVLLETTEEVDRVGLAIRSAVTC